MIVCSISVVNAAKTLRYFEQVLRSSLAWQITQTESAKVPCFVRTTDQIVQTDEYEKIMYMVVVDSHLNFCKGCKDAIMSTILGNFPLS